MLYSEIPSIIYHPDVQVEVMILLTRFEGRSLVAEAALSGNKATFEAVLTTLRERLHPDQVTYLLFFLDYIC